MKLIYTPDLCIRLRQGGTIDLSVCRDDKIEILRSVLHSLHLNRSANELAQKLIAEVDRAPKDGGVWANVTRLVKSPNCDLCGGETRWGAKKGRFNFCDKHNTWRTYIKLRQQNTFAESLTDETFQIPVN